MDKEENRLDQFLARYKFPLGMGLVGLVLLIGGIASSGILPKTFSLSNKTRQIANPTPVRQVSAKVDVSGAVTNPGVYALSSEARVEDALKAAGGVTISADPVYLSKSLNLAQKVTDGMKIYVPVANEAGPSAMVAGAQASVAVGGPININVASASELDQLSGVGLVTAQKIIDARPYSSIDELVIKKVVTRSVYDKIKDRIVLY